MIGRADLDTPLDVARTKMQCSPEKEHSKHHCVGCTNGLSKTTGSAYVTPSTKICAVVYSGKGELDVWGHNLVSTGEPSATIWATYNKSSAIALIESCAFPAEGEEDEDLIQLLVEKGMCAHQVRLDAHRVGYTSSSWRLPPIPCQKQLSEDFWFCAIKDREAFNGRLGLTSFVTEAGSKQQFCSLAQGTTATTGHVSPDDAEMKLLLELSSKLQQHIQVQANLPEADFPLHICASSWDRQNTWKGRGAMYIARRSGCEMLILKQISVSTLSPLPNGDLDSIWGQIAKLNPSLRTRDTFSIVSDILWAEESLLVSSLGANAGVMVDNSSSNTTPPPAIVSVGDAAGLPMPPLQAYNKHASGLKASFLFAYTPHNIQAWKSVGRTIVAYRLRQVQRIGKIWKIGNPVTPSSGQKSVCEI